MEHRINHLLIAAGEDFVVFQKLMGCQEDKATLNQKGTPPSPIDQLLEM